ncbi:response regulator receiver modulated diguanylate cyclase with PAS/PAC sensor [Geotalea uraniireducens Rf4]|uniref:Response regulator receiver modulated diguanylate cyclase with PAS/PAC sensor n=1 Tax=Geotalea uraniireducens (strain Rf4) TaxID=351605 RepID=A5GDS7_GEOUR|nr:response regulator receiver modulated diguanylate cyclase with PAS/PAC sensor [Geotalea uraniireducens Rf4]
MPICVKSAYFIGALIGETVVPGEGAIVVDTKSVRILYMEDDAGLARILQKTMQRLGYIIDLAGNGEEGLAMAERREYDTVLVDYNMPVCGGIDVLRILTARQKHPPVIMVTGNGNEKVAVEALKLGATDYIVKDVDMGYLELLPLVIGQVLQKQHLINEREQMLAAMQESEGRYRKLVELSPDGIVICARGRFVFINPAGVTLLGAPGPKELLGMAMIDFVHPDYRDIFKAQMRQLEDNGYNVPWIEERFIRFDMADIDVEVSGVPFTFRGEAAVQIIFRDITERTLAKRRLEQMAHYDTLTSLPNRALFFDRFTTMLEQAKRYGTAFALLYLDLDSFKQVNDSLGHDVGDLLLKKVTERLTGNLRKSDTVARMGGDEFTVILSRINEREDAAVVARKIIYVLSMPFDLKGNQCSIGVSIGISVFPDDGDDTETLLKNADTAMYSAKESDREKYQYYVSPEAVEQST